MKKKAIAISVSALVGACASGAPPEGKAPAPPPPATENPPTPAKAKAPRQAQFESECLARLRALQVFSVGQVIEGQPEETFSCYGPCSALGKVVAHAEAAMLATDPVPADSCEPKAVADNLAVIERAGVVHVEGLLVERAKTPAEEGAARKVTCDRAAKLARIAAGLKNGF